MSNNNLSVTRRLSLPIDNSYRIKRNPSRRSLKRKGMSEADYYETSSDSFWEIGQYKRTVKRTEESYKLCNDLMQMLSERASLEKMYAKSLKTWSKKWSDYLDKSSSEYGSMKLTWQALLNESTRLSDIHTKIHDDLEDNLITDIKSWQKTYYPKTLMGQLKIVKQFDDDFNKAQKPWAKKYVHNEKSKKEYHNVCKLLQSARIQETNARNDASLAAEQKKKYEDKVDKLKKEVESAKHKYQQSLDEINSFNSHYIEDMKNVYKKCDAFEKQRLDFFIQKFTSVHTIIDLTQKSTINDIYNDLITIIQSTNPDKDLQSWSRVNGDLMNMNWPQFDEYSEELKPIGKGTRASKYNKDLNNEDGVTMTSIKQKEEFISQDSSSISPEYEQQRSWETQASKSSFDDNWIASGAQSNDSIKRASHQESLASKSNPFDSDDDTGNNRHVTEDDNYSAISNQSKQTSSNNINGPVNYLNIKVKAIYDYHSSEDDELSFKSGDEFIKLAYEDDRGWCLGKIGDRVGLYPATYAIDL